MYLFIFESIGTSELILIGAVALIVFGPRKLPQMARTLGKAMADFKNTTNEFKSTWEREANFEAPEPAGVISNSTTANHAQQIAANDIKDRAHLPEIKEIDAAQFNLSPTTEAPISNKIESKALTPAEKQNWL